MRVLYASLFELRQRRCPARDSRAPRPRAGGLYVGLRALCLLLGLTSLGAHAQTPTFAPVATYSSGGSNPFDIAVADVNGDGIPDLLTANYGSNTAGVLLGTGTGSFQAATAYSTGTNSQPRSIAVADVNGDGKPDLLTANFSNSTAGVLLGNGNGTFQAATAYGTGTNSEPFDIAVADVNGDGKLDLLTANYGSNNAAVLLGNGNGTFRAATTYGTGSGSNPQSIAVADVNGDGKLDLLTANFSNSTAGVLLGNGNGTFQATTGYSTGTNSQPKDIAVADVNGDGKPDLLIANSTGNTAAVLLGNGNGTFQAATTYGSGGGGFINIAVADVNGDGKLDLLTANYGSNNAGVLLGNGNGTFQAATTYGTGSGSEPVSIAVADVNGDGKLDVFTANYNSGTAGVLLNTTVYTPTVTTAAATSITNTSAVLGGNVTDQGVAAVTDRGVVYSSTNATPTISDTKDANGSGTGSFSKTISGLATGTTYYVRAYATNSAGTGYGGVQTFTTTNTTTVISTSVNRTITNSTNTNAVFYYFEFGQTVSGVSASNFAFTTTGTVQGGSIFNVRQDPNNNRTIDVAVFPGPGDGTLRLDLVNGAGISPRPSNVPFRGNVVTVDNTPPTATVSSSAGASGGTTPTTPIPFTVTFSEPVVGFGQGNVSVTNGTVSSFAGSGASYSFNVTPTTPGTATTVSVAANVAQDQAANGNTASNAYTLTYVQPITAAPTVTAPANGSFVNTTTPTYSGTAPAGSTVTVYVDGASIGTTSANASGSFSLAQPTALAQGSHTVRATAQASSQAGSASSNTNTFTVTAAPTVSSFTPTQGAVGTTVTLTGTDFTGATAVRFGNINAPTFSVTSNTSLTVTVPAGVVLAPISVLTPGGASRYVGAGNGLFAVPACTATAQVTPAGPLSLPAGGSATLTATATTPGFNVQGSGFNGLVYAVAVQADGKVLVGGSFASYNGNAAVPKGVLRLNADGSLDNSFNNGGTGANNPVYALALQADGKVLVGGAFTSYNGNAAAPDNVLRLNPDGSLDNSFNNGGAGANDQVQALALQADGKVLVGGSFASYNGNAAPDGVLRLNADGSLDNSFNSGGAGANSSVRALAVQADGKVLVGGSFTSYNGNAAPDNVLRLNADGSLDNTFNNGGTGTNGGVKALALQPDGKVVVGGQFTAYNGNAAPVDVLRLNADGSLDNSFNNGGTGTNSNNTVYALAVQADGKVLVGGGVLTSYNGNTAAPDGVLRLNADGSLDNSFNNGGSGANSFVYAVAVQADGRVLVGGAFSAYNGSVAAPDRLLRLNADGSLNDAATPLPGATFVFNPGNTAGSTRTVNAAGTYTATATDPASGCTYTSNAVVVTVTAAPTVSSFTPTQGAVGTTVTLTGTDFTGATAVRFGNINAPTFSVTSNTSLTVTVPAGVVLAPISVLTPGGASRYVGAGNGLFAVPACTATAQVTPAGPLSLPAGGSATLTATATTPGFNVQGSGFNNDVFAVVVQPDGKVLVGGFFTAYNGNAAAPDRVLRLNADGSLDTSFNNGGSGFNGDVFAVAVQADGKVLVGGQFTAYNGNAAAPDRVLRLNADGSLDTSFNNGGSGFNGDVFAVAVQADGKVLVGGTFNSYNGNAAAPQRVLRLNTDGSLDNTFNNGGTGADATVQALAVQADGKVLVGGGFASYNGNAAPAGVLRLNADGSLDNSFNNGGAGSPGSTSTVSALAVQADGKVLVGGDFTAYNGNAAAPDRVLRLNADGSLDTSYNPGGSGFNVIVRALAVQADGKVLVGGDFTAYNGSAAAPDYVLRLNADGSLDNTFNNGGAGANNNVNALAVQADGKVLIGGGFTAYNGNAAAPDDLLRLNADGSLNNAATPLAGATFVFNPGNTPGNTRTVNAAGTYTATATDPASGCTYTSNAVVVTVAPTIAVAPATLPDGTVGAAYSQTITASGGTAPYTYAISAGALPTGLTLTPAGVLAGTPTAGGTFNFTVTATDASPAPGPYSGSRAYSLTIGSQPVTAAPVVSTPANNSSVNTTTPTYSGTAPAGSTVTVFVDGASVGSTTATAGSFSLAQPTALAQGPHTVYARAQTNGAAVSGNSNPNNFTVDTVAPTVAISSTAGASGGTTPTSPIPFTVTFSEAVTGFSAAGVSVTNGTVSGFAGAGGTTYTFNVTPTTAGTVTTVSVAANQARDAATNGNMPSNTYALTYSQPLTATSWTGTLSTDWFTAGNWSAGVPTASVDALVPAGTPYSPLVATGTASAKNLTLNSGATLSQSSGTLTLTGNFTNNGTFAATGGTVATSGSASQVLGGSSPLAFQNLSIGAAGAALATSASFQGVLALAGDLTTNSRPLTLLSRVSGGQAIDGLVVNNGGVVVGTTTVQRAIDPSLNSGPGYRHYASPVTNTTVADLATSRFTPTVNPAYNASAAPTTVSPFPTVYGYDDSRLALTNNLAPFDKGFVSPQGLSDPLAVGRGYTVNLAASELVDFQGTLNTDDKTLALTSSRPTYPTDGGWQLLGNPYPAPLDYSLVVPADRAGLEAAIFVYHSTGPYVGQYRSYVNRIGNPVLPIGQGFFARVADGQSSATLTFRNSQRLTSPNATAFQRTAADARPLVALTLQGAGSPLLDEATVYFEDGATSSFEPAFDAQKLPNPTGLNVATSLADGHQLSIDGQPVLGTSQRVVPLAVGVPTPGVYTFTASQLLNLSAVPVYLRDLQLGTLTDLRLQPSYQFTVSNATALNTTRFALVFSPQQALATVAAALAQQVAVYPNPAKTTTQLTLEVPAALGQQPITATLLDALGRVVLQQELPAGRTIHKLPLTDLATGMYSLRLTTPSGVVVKKLVIE